MSIGNLRGTSLTLSFNTKCYFILMYLCQVCKMTFYIEIGHFLKKPTTTQHLNQNVILQRTQLYLYDILGLPNVS